MRARARIEVIRGTLDRSRPVLHADGVDVAPIEVEPPPASGRIAKARVQGEGPGLSATSLAAVAGIGVRPSIAEIIEDHRDQHARIIRAGRHVE